MDTTTNFELTEITPEDSAVPIFQSDAPPLVEETRWATPDEMIQEQQNAKESAIQKLMKLGMTREEALALGGNL